MVSSALVYCYKVLWESNGLCHNPKYTHFAKQQDAKEFAQQHNGRIETKIVRRDFFRPDVEVEYVANNTTQ